MHTFKSGNFVFNYNGDFSGDVEVTDLSLVVNATMRVPYDALAAFVAESVRSRRISELEDMTTEELLR